MSELRFRLVRCEGCLVDEVGAVMVKGEDRRWRYWIEFQGQVIPGEGDFAATRNGHVRLKARALDQFERLLLQRPGHAYGTRDSAR